jgi:hypothetical protein
MTAPALNAGGVISGVIGGISSILHWNSEDLTTRLPLNQQAYGAAVNGDENALAFLFQRSGRAPGTAFVPYWGGDQPIGAWETRAAQEDAWTKYQLVEGKVQVENLVNQTGGAIQTELNKQGLAIVPTPAKVWQVLTSAAREYAPLLIGVALVGVLLIVKKR